MKEEIGGFISVSAAFGPTYPIHLRKPVLRLLNPRFSGYPAQVAAEFAVHQGNLAYIDDPSEGAWR